MKVLIDLVNILNVVWAFFYFQDGLTPPGGLWGEQSLVEAQAPWREPVAEEEAVSAQKTATVTLLKSLQSAALLVSHENDELLR